MMMSSWRSVADRFFDNALTAPNAVAIEARGAVLSYADLAARVDLFAARLGERDVTPGAIVAVCLDRTVDLPAWLLAIHVAGAAYLPLDPELPRARLSLMLEDASPALIIVSREYIERLPQTDIAVLIAEIEQRATPVPRATIPSDMRAYIIYTSGSTGRPKGVEIEQGSLAAVIDAMADTLRLRQGESMLGLTRISFDLSVGELFLPLYVGGTLILADLNVAASPALLARALDLHRPDLVSATPSTWRALIESGWQGSPDLRLTTGGEAITRDLADQLIVRSRAVWNMYGPTEATVWATSYLISAGAGQVPIGRPMTGVTIRILDSDRADVAVGATGEIAISGHGVRRGYLNRPELTASRYMPQGDGELTYLTGDLGRVGEDGLLYYLGRLDDQVKIRGFRIELGDVEAALCAHPEVAFGSIRVWPDRSGDAALVAYVVQRSGAVEAMAGIRRFLEGQLPAYMVPSRIEFIARLPLTPNGKIDRAALANPFAVDDAPTDRGADRTIPSRLAAIWRDLLGVRALAPGDDFFDLGGYSLMTVRLGRRIETEFGRKVTLINLMRHSTLERMADLIELDDDEHSSEMMLLNDGGGTADIRPPLYWLDAGPLMRTMARAMSAGQPVYALNLDAADEAMLDGDIVDIAAIAARLRAALTAAQPIGPYYLGGWCRWGIVAYELACQLETEGRRVALLVMLDAERPRLRSWYRRVRSGIGVWLRPASTMTEAKSFSQKVETAAAAFIPKPLSAAVLLIRPPGCPADGGWRPLLGHTLQTERVPGDHVSMVRMPHVATLAEAIDRHLLTAQYSGTMTR